MNDNMEHLMRTAHQFKRLPFDCLIPEVSRGEYMLLAAIGHLRNGDDHIRGPIDHQETQNNQLVGVGQLAKVMRCSTPAVSKMLRGLEAEGWLERRVDAKDRRNTWIFLTPAGEQLLKDGAARMQVVMDRMVAQIGERRLEEFCDTLEETYRTLDEIIREECNNNQK